MPLTSKSPSRLLAGLACVLAAGALAQAAPTSRQKALAHSRRLQREIRVSKQAAREARRAAEPAATPGPPVVPPLPEVRPAAPRPRLSGVFCLLILGLGAWTDPAVLQSLAHTDAFDPYLNEASRGLEALDTVCLPAALAGRALPPCEPGYRSGVVDQARDVLARARRLFRAPEELGAGWCLVGESVPEAKERIALIQSDQLAEFDRLAAQGSALMYQLNRDAFLLQAVGSGLHTGQAALLATGNGTLAKTAAFTLGQVGDSLAVGAYVLGAVGDAYGELSGLAGAKRSIYQRYANAQDAKALNCTGAPGPGEADGLTGIVSPLPALETALQGMEEGCALAARHHLDLPVCEGTLVETFHSRNATIAHLYRHGIACLTAGILRGRQAPCPTTPLSDARTRSDTITYYDEFAGLVTAAGDRALGFGNGLFAGARGLLIAGNAAARAGSTQEAAGLITASSAVALSAASVYSQGFDLLRIAALSRAWLAEVIQAFNAESMAHLDGREEEGPTAEAVASTASGSSSSTGPEAWVLAVVSRSAEDLPGSSSAQPPPPGGGPTLADPEEPAASSASRLRNPGLLEALRRLLPCPRRTAEGDL